MQNRGGTSLDSEHLARQRVLNKPWSKIELFPTQTRGTRGFVAVDEKSSIRDTWRAVYLSEIEDSAALLKCKGLASVDHSIPIMPHPRYIILDAIRTPLTEFSSTHALVSYVLHAVLGELLFIEHGAITQRLRHHPCRGSTKEVPPHPQSNLLRVACDDNYPPVL